MATHDYVISNASGAAVRADLNNALAAIVSSNSNATEPSTTYSYMLWADTGSSPPVMKLRNAANDGWVTLFQLDGEWSTLAVEDGTAASPSIYFKDSGTDTGIYSSGTDEVAIATGGTERVKIDADGQTLSAQSLSYTGRQYVGIAERSASSAYSYLYAWSGGLNTDLEFNLRGDGNAYCDGTWNGGGADYAEFFEWSDENPDAEDRRGISVVLDGDKIRPALVGEDPIGVISGNPSIVGDAAWNKWNGKYLRDEYGTYIQEDYKVVNEKGKAVIQQRRKLNADYNPNQEYINREQRPEWDCVGLIGKLRIRKGQPIGSRWIKMRDISNSVEEWLVR